jgi:protein-disulfide isomerase
MDTGKVKWVVYPYYLGNPEMGFAVEAAWCAHDQDRYFDYQHALFENQGRVTFNNNTLTDLAVGLGLDQEQFSQCLNNREHRDDVDNARQTAINRGVNSTPTFFVNNRRLEGNQPYSIFQQYIDQELASAQ